MRTYILPNTTFGHWRVIRQEGKAYNGSRLYVCVCSCGKKGKLRTEQLRGGLYRSCGCRRAFNPALKRWNNQTRKDERNRKIVNLFYGIRNKAEIGRRFDLCPSSVRDILNRNTPLTSKGQQK